MGIDRNFNHAVSMLPFFQEIEDELPSDFGESASTPTAIFLFDESDNPLLLSEGQKNMFHLTLEKAFWGGRLSVCDLICYLICHV
jgi:hypothetical protein